MIVTETVTEHQAWHTPTLQEVVTMLYPAYAHCKAVEQRDRVFGNRQDGPLYPRKGFVFVVMADPDGRKFLLEVHENCFRTDGPQPRPENAVTMNEAEDAIFGETYTVLPSGRSIVCQLTLSMGHTEEGIAHVIDAENFNLKKGREAARRKAMDGVFRYLAQRKREFVGHRATTQD